MDKMNVFANGDDQEKPPPRKCPRCESDNTKFCYYNNYSVSQPRYSCKNCRRYWTHGGALRNIPIGGSSRKAKRPKVAQSSGFHVIYVENQQVNYQTFLQVKENTDFVGSVGASSSLFGNHFGSLPSIHMDGGMITDVPPIGSFPLVDPLDFLDRLYEQDYYGVISNDLIGNPLINQSFVGHVDNHNSYGINQMDQSQWNQSFNNTMNMNHNASTSGNGGSDTNMNHNASTSESNCVVYSCHLEKQDP